MTIYLGADHGGYALKEALKPAVTAWGFTWEDLGNTVLDASDDYPFYALAVAKKVAHDLRLGKHAKGILACRTAAGMAIVANKVNGIRAAAPCDIPSAILSREHNDANILVLAGDFLREKEALKMAKTWLASKFTGEERHRRRLEQIKRFEDTAVEVTPGINEIDFPQIARKIRLVDDFVKTIHIDVLDGTLFGNTNFHDPAPFAALSTQAYKEAHLMVAKPEAFVEPLAAAGFRRLIIHRESLGLEQCFKKAKIHAMNVMMALDVDTPVQDLEPFLTLIDGVLVMTVHAGASNRPFVPESLKKIVWIREKYHHLPIAVDGGITDVTAPVVVAAGADRIIATSYIFGSTDYKKAIETLKTLR